MLPNNPKYLGGERFNFSISGINFACSYHFGILHTKENLRPNLSISRNSIVSFPWKTYFRLTYLIKSTLKKSEYSLTAIFGNYSLDFYKSQSLISEIINDELTILDYGWKDLLVLKGTKLSLSSITESDLRTELHSRLLFYSDELLYNCVLFKNFEYKIKLFKKCIDKNSAHKKYSLEYVSYVSPKKSDNVNSFVSLITCEYENFNGLVPFDLGAMLYNKKHDFTKWLISNYAELFKNYNHHLNLLMTSTSSIFLNNTITKLKKILPEEMKPNFTLTKEDFEVDFTKLEELPENES